MLCCVYKMPYERAEPWRCSECGLLWALPIAPERSRTRGIRARAIELLDIIASQQEWQFGTRTLPGYGPRWSPERTLAEGALIRATREWSVDEWPAIYAHAAQLIRDGWPRATTTTTLDELVHSAVVRPLLEAS